MAGLFTALWIGVTLSHLFAQSALSPVERHVIGLDGMVLLPLMFIGGWLLWCNRPWGYLLAAILLTKLAALGFTLLVNTGLLMVLATVRQLVPNSVIYSHYGRCPDGLNCVSGWHCHSPRRNPSGERLNFITTYRTIMRACELVLFNLLLCHPTTTAPVKVPPVWKKFVPVDCKKNRRLEATWVESLCLSLGCHSPRPPICRKNTLIWPAGEEVEQEVSLGRADYGPAGIRQTSVFLACRTKPAQYSSILTKKRFQAGMADVDEQAF